MAESNGITLVPKGPLQLASQVVIGTVDVSAAGARVLLALQPPAGWTIDEVAVDVRGFDGSAEGELLRPVLSSTEPADAGPSGSPQQGIANVVVRNMYGPGAAASLPQVSLVILNAAVPEGAQAEVAAALLELLTPPPSAPAAGSPTSLFLVAAMLLHHLPRPAPLYQHLLNGAKPLTAAALPLLPTSSAAAGASAAATAASATRVRDGQLAALLHVMAVSGQAACCLLAPGHKPPASTQLDLPDSAAACDALGGALAAATGLVYDAARCRAVRATHKWFVPEKSAGSDVMYM